MRRKKDLTPEQQAARDERRAKIKDLCAKLRALSPEARAKIAGDRPVITVDGRGLSVHNNCFAVMQSPAATIVGGFNQWKKAGRFVRAGEHGFSIWAPTDKGGESEAELQPPADGAPATDRRRFILVTVFDVAQTEAADPAPESEAANERR